MPDAAYFLSFARYNRWANHRLYEACGRLPEAVYKSTRRAFFRSIHGALNHLLVGDRIWLGRITGQDSGIARLDAILYEDFATLRAARITEDERLIEVVGGLTDAAIGRNLVYRNTSGAEFSTRLDLVLAHLFNHEAHHRGQVHDMLSQTDVPPPELDLIIYLRTAEPTRQ